jgi:hypothetical protein
MSPKEAIAQALKILGMNDEREPNPEVRAAIARSIALQGPASCFGSTRNVVDLLIACDAYEQIPGGWQFLGSNANGADWRVEVFQSAE